MRIQETNEVLKEARVARRANPENHPAEGFMARTWNRITGLFKRS